MYYVTERKERKTRTHAMVLAIGLHLSLAALLYTQMSEPSTYKSDPPVKINKAKEVPTPATKTLGA